jgi:hypothetical protein
VENLEWLTQRENCSKHDKYIGHPRQVLQLNDKGDVLHIYTSVTSAATALGVSRAAISKACLGVNKTSMGFQWQYQDGDYLHQLPKSCGKEVNGYPNYLIYDDGAVYSMKRKMYLKPVHNDAGYQYVTLSNSLGKSNMYVHILVASHYLEKKTNCVVNHKDLNKSNNNVENLEWISSSENRIHAHINRRGLWYQG